MNLFYSLIDYSLINYNLINLCFKTLGETTPNETKNNPQVVNPAQIKCDFPVQIKQEPSIKKQKRSNVSVFKIIFIKFINKCCIFSKLKLQWFVRLGRQQQRHYGEGM